MSGLAVPDDPMAEEDCVGCAVATRAGARYAATHVEPGDFYRPWLGRVFAACGELDDVTDEAERIARVAEIADVEEAVVRGCVERRPRMWDTTGRAARTVARHAQRRRLMKAAADLFNAAGAGEPDELVAALATRLLEIGRAA